MKTRSLLFLLAFLAAAPAAFAQQGQEENGLESIIPKDTVTVDLSQNDIIDDPFYGVVIIPKTRWKNWVERSALLFIINLALLGIIFSIPKNDEATVVISYVFSGVSAILAFWTSLCAVLLFRLSSSAWIYVMPMSLLCYFLTWVVLMRVKKSDVSLSELKESFQQLARTSAEDPRLSSVSGVPGDWPDKDIIR